MLDLRQLKFFVVSADMGSFSEASKVLYTTQSAISKSVAALERQLGFELFLRGGRGISLTEKGASFYLRANELLTSAESLEREAEEKSSRYVNLAANPGTWFADNFAEFYEMHQDEQLHFRILTDSTSQVMRWVKNGAAELGFVFVFPDDNGQFDYDLRRYQLQFEALRTVNGMLYMSPEHMSGIQKSSRDSGKQMRDTLPEPAKEAEKLHALRYIQMGQDEFSGEHLWQDKETGDILEKPDVAVITNSDHIMHMMLKKHLLANISAETFYQYPDGHRPGIPLACGDGNIQYGILSRQNAGISEPAARFAQFLRERLQDR